MQTLKVTDHLRDTVQRKQEYDSTTAEMVSGHFGVRSIYVVSFHPVFSKQISS